MGICWNCGTQITLKEEEIKCDNCGKVINYQCNYCHKWFLIYDEKREERVKECGICGFFICPYCGTCSQDCEKLKWQIEINKILSPEISYSTFPNLQEKINSLLNLIEEIKINKEQRQCPKGVPITYAKNRIKSCIVRMLGYRTKSDKDLKAFVKRYQEIINVPIGIQLTINQSREEGSYGQEYRDIFNLAICRGKLKKQIIKKEIDGERKEIEVWRRVEDGQCPKLNTEKLLLKICSKCKKEYPLESPQEYCGCYTYTKGKNKGWHPKLKLKISNKDICQLNRGSFLKDGER